MLLNVNVSSYCFIVKHCYFSAPPFSLSFFFHHSFFEAQKHPPLRNMSVTRRLRRLHVNYMSVTSVIHQQYVGYVGYMSVTCVGYVGYIPIGGGKMKSLLVC